MSEKKRHRVIIGIELFLLCMIIVTLSINAASSNPPSNGVSYNKNNQTTVQNALDDLYTKANYGNATATQILKGRTALVGGKQVTGTLTIPTLASQTPGDATKENIDKGKIAWVNGEKIVGTRAKNVQKLGVLLHLGEYIRYPLSNTKYTLSKEETGYNSDQTINAQGYALGRVIRKNEDGTVELVFYNAIEVRLGYGYKDMTLEGYQNCIGLFNKIASFYENENITAGSRAMGYDGTATEYLSEYVETPDTGYETDIALVENALGGLEVGNLISYYLASRGEKYYVRYIKYCTDTSGCYDDVYSGGTSLGYKDWGLNNRGSYRLYMGVRPIVVLRSDVVITSGDGTVGSPYIVGE